MFTAKDILKHRKSLKSSWNTTGWVVHCENGRVVLRVQYKRPANHLPDYLRQICGRCKINFGDTLRYVSSQQWESDVMDSYLGSNMPLSGYDTCLQWFGVFLPMLRFYSPCVVLQYLWSLRCILCLSLKRVVCRCACINHSEHSTA